uniref:Uncharacterized protein n=1 Tax=Anguilla anguilla TaxID=7936 RepID=A0A0E9QBE7_ANGAN
MKERWDVSTRRVPLGPAALVLYELAKEAVDQTGVTVRIFLIQLQLKCNICNVLLSLFTSHGLSAGFSTAPPGPWSHTGM